MKQGDYYFEEVYQTIDDTFDYLRRKWNIKIIKGLFCGYTRFKDFLDGHPDLSSKVLAERLKELEQKGIIEKKIANSNPFQTEYYLTKKGRRLNKIIFELFDFALDEVMENKKDSKQKKKSKKNLRICLNL